MYVLFGILSPFIHELGHFLVAAAFGKRIHFIRKGFRFLWNMPEGLDEDEAKFVAIAGFAFEFAFAGFINFVSSPGCMIYLMVAVLHLIAYPFYAGSNNDFKFLS
jgi:hypothetical protein